METSICAEAAVSHFRYLFPKSIFIPRSMNPQLDMIILPLYDAMMKDGSGSPLEAVHREPFDAKTLIDAMKPVVPDTYERSVGVGEGYTLERHTLMVLGQYMKYFNGRSLPGGLTHPQFRLFLAMHDLGKPEAHRRGNKNDQARFNLPLFQSLFPFQPFIGPAQRDMLESFLTDDPVGGYLRNKRGNHVTEQSMVFFRDTCVSRLEQMYSPRFGVTRSEYLEAFLVYYMVDAGSYTLDAGGSRSLDHHFHFGEESMDFSDTSKPWVDAVRNRFV